MNRWALAYLHCVSPLHNGSGEGLGALDRPVVREAATQLPFIQSSTLKGALRVEARILKKDPEDRVVLAAFGDDSPGGSQYQGCVVLTDAMLLALPVRSLAGTFVWATSRLALARLERWLAMAGETAGLRALIGNVLDTTQALGRGRAVGCSSNEEPCGGERWDAAIRLDGTGSYCLEQLLLTPFAAGTAEDASRALANLAHAMGEKLFPNETFWQEFFRARLLLASDADFDHLAQQGTQVEANIQILESGVTKEGSLRYTEFLPAETVLAALVCVEHPRNGATQDETWDLLVDLASKPRQFGADESKGKGLAYLRLCEVPKDQKSGEEEKSHA